jgi:hypothetical protein
MGFIRIYMDIWYMMVGGWPTPLKNDGVSSSVGMIIPFPTEWKVIKHVPNHQPVIKYWEVWPRSCDSQQSLGLAHQACGVPKQCTRAWKEWTHDLRLAGEDPKKDQRGCLHSTSKRLQLPAASRFSWDFQFVFPATFFLVGSWVTHHNRYGLIIWDRNRPTSQFHVDPPCAPCLDMFCFWNPFCQNKHNLCTLPIITIIIIHKLNTNQPWIRPPFISFYIHL